MRFYYQSMDVENFNNMENKLPNGTKVTISGNMLKPGKKHLLVAWGNTPATVEVEIDGSTEWEGEGEGYRYSLKISPGRSIFWISKNDFELVDSKK